MEKIIIRKKLILLALITLAFSCYKVYAAGPKKTNLGFESGTFNGWVGTAWIYRTTNPAKFTQPVVGIDPFRHFIMTDKSGYDPNTGNRLKLIPPGYNYSAKLGTSSIPPGETVIEGQHQTLSYTMKVDSSNALLVWMFALVLQDPTNNHRYDEEPRFKISLHKENGDTIPDCSYYDVYAGDAGIQGFQTYTPTGANSPVVWRDWTAVGANLLPYIGQTITIEFLSAGCTRSGHYGYGYFVVDCLPLYITVDYCRNSLDATLIGPEGFSVYDWKDEKGVTVGTSQILTVKDPKEGSKYSCNLTSATGCKVTLTSTISRYEPKADFTSKMVDCQLNEVLFENKSSILNGKIDFLWDFGEGITSIVKNPTYKFKTSGLHEVSLIVYNPPSGCTDTLLKTVESFSPPLVGIDGFTTYCPDEKTRLKGFGAYEYKWSTGIKADSLEIGSPGGKYWMEGYSSTGCKAKVSFDISEEPDWNFSVSDISILCRGDTLKLEALGGAKYLWNTGDSTNSIMVSKEGTYHVTGTNPRGCSKQLSIKLDLDELPLAGFELDKNVVDKRHNTITGKIKQEDNVKYSWEMGDGMTGAGNIYSHSYSLSANDLLFNVKLNAINENNCKSNSTQSVIVDVFVPNVFTPNNDGTNDLFMQGYNIEVFDRNGIALYKGTDGWDGIYKGKWMEPDTYFYVLEYLNYKQEKNRKQGYITLVR